MPGELGLMDPISSPALINNLDTRLAEVPPEIADLPATSDDQSIGEP